jgi:hypothetical protein
VRKFWKLTTVTGAAVVLATMAAAGPAVAGTQAPSGYGFDNNPDVIVGGGSDTTAKLMNEIGALYETGEINNGCAHVNPASGDPEQDWCDGTTDRPFNDSNWDGDTVAEANPTGSGAGRQALLNGAGTGNYHGTVNVASNPQRTDAGATGTLGSAIINDAAITAADTGKMVTGTGVPDPAFVEGVIPGVSFHISASANSFNGAAPVDWPATAAVAGVKISTYGDMTAATSPGPVPDFGRSSSTADTKGCATETFCSTFWGYANDMVEVIGFGTHGAELNSMTHLDTLNPAMLNSIWSCTGGSGPGGRWEWQDIPDAKFAGDTALIVPWEMNSASGTYKTFGTFVGAPDPGNAGINALGTCSAELPHDADAGLVHSGGTLPLENNVVPLFQSVEHKATFGTGDLNPENWLWFGSFGVFSAFPFTSSYTTSATAANIPNTFFQGSAAKVAPTADPGCNAAPFTCTAGTVVTQSQLPSTDLASPYKPSRVLWQVTRKGDADCPAQLVSGSRSCNFAGNPGPIAFGRVNGTTCGTVSTPACVTDLNVTGPTWDGVVDVNGHPTHPTGTGGAVREFTRWLCRANVATEGVDPYTGVNDANAITSVIQANGFSVVPTGLRSSGSRCDVQS